MKIARTLMDEYGLSQSDVELYPEGHKDAGHVKPDQMGEAEGYRCRDLWPWEKHLGFVCEGLLPVKYFIRGGCIVFVGATSDSGLAAEVYRILRKELLRLSLSEYGAINRRSFLSGAVETLKERVKAMNAEKAAAENTGRALVVVKANDVALYVKKHYNFTKGQIRGSRCETWSYERGRQAGHSVNLSFGTHLK
jgi:hypothetical protein